MLHTAGYRLQRHIAAAAKQIEHFPSIEIGTDTGKDGLLYFIRCRPCRIAFDRGNHAGSKFTCNNSHFFQLLMYKANA